MRRYLLRVFCKAVLGKPATAKNAAPSMCGPSASNFLLQTGIDDQRLAAGAAGEQIGVGAGHAVEQLAEDHGRSPRLRQVICGVLYFYRVPA